MSYHDVLHKLTATVAQQVTAAYSSWLAGRLTRDEFVQLVALYIASGNQRAVAVADLALAAALSVELRAVQPVAGVTRPDDVERLQKGAQTLAERSDAGEDVTARLTRLATAEPVGAAAAAWSEGIRRNKNVTGWVRQLDSDPCELCQSWAQDGRVWPSDVTMLHHPGCECTPKPITKG